MARRLRGREVTHWIQAEAEGRWLRYNQYLNINESNYLIGPGCRSRPPRLARHPYAKVLIGLGKMNFEFNSATGSFTDVAYGGGVDIK